MEDVSSGPSSFSPLFFICLIIFAAWFQYYVMDLSVAYIVIDTIIFIAIMTSFANSDGE